MPLTQYLEASGKRVHAGRTGLLYTAPSGGRVYCSKASLKGIDQNLYAILKMAAWDLGIAIQINSVDTGQHATNSRHYKGCAVDINRVGRDKETWQQATLENRDAMRLYFYLRSAGLQIGERRGGRSVPGVIFGPIGHRYNPSTSDHSTHIHASVVARHRS